MTDINNCPNLAKVIHHYELDPLDDLFERVPRIAEQMNKLWGTPEFVEYSNQLFFSDRNNREGFDNDVIKDIFILSEIHESEYPALYLNMNDPFSKPENLPIMQIIKMEKQAKKNDALKKN